MVFPNDINSHPHYSNSGDLVIIHNGIIENYESIKKALLKRGVYVFESDTDTEVLVNLIEEVKQKEAGKIGESRPNCFKSSYWGVCYSGF